MIRKTGLALVRPLRAVWRFGSWVRRSHGDTAAVYGPDPNDLSPEERIVKAGVIAGRLVTHRFGFDQVAEAYDLFDDPVASGALKVAVLR